jgi:hypothetical protein
MSLSSSAASSAPASQRPLPPTTPRLRPQETSGNLNKDLDTELFELPEAAAPGTPPPSPRPVVTDQSAPN